MARPCNMGTRGLIVSNGQLCGPRLADKNSYNDRIKRSIILNKQKAVML